MNERDFVFLHEHAPERIERLVQAALRLKKRPPADKPLAGKKVALVFMNPSLRTRMSFEFAVGELGGHAAVVVPGSDAWKLEHRTGVVMDGDAVEHVREAIGVMARYSDAIGLRAFPGGKSWAEERAEPVLSAVRAATPVPLVNLESATGHPCQGLADLMTIREHMDPRGKTFLLTWAPHVKALPTAVPNTAVEIAALAGMHVRIARPAGYDLDPDVVSRVRRHCETHGTRFEVTDAVDDAFDGAHVVYAKAWGSLEKYGLPPDAALRPRWTVSEKKMRRTQRGVFMHCLPVRRNLVVDDAVLDGPASVVLDQAENRLHTTKALLTWMLGPDSDDDTTDHLGGSTH